MSGDISDFYVHTVTVETFNGAGAFGPVYADPVTLSPNNTPPNGVYLDGKLQTVRSSDGEQVVSAATVYCSVADGAKFTPDSRVTDASGRTAQVISVNTLDMAGTMPGVEHTAIYLT